MKLIKKDTLISQIAKKAGIDVAKATIAYETVLLESPSFRKQSVKTVQAKKEVAVKVPGKSVVKKVNLTKEKAVKTGASTEKIKIVEVKVPVPVVKIKEVIKEVQVIKEVPVVVEKTVIKEVKVIQEVPVEVIKEITLVREVEKIVIKEVKVKDAKAIKALEGKITGLEKKLTASNTEAKSLKKQLSAKPKTIIKEVIKEVPVEIIREIEVVKQIDFASLQKMMKGMKTVEVSKTVVGETRTKKEGKVVARREVKAGSRSVVTSKETTTKSSSSKSSDKPSTKKESTVKATEKKTTAKKTTVKKSTGSKKDDLTKIEGIGPKISGLLHAGGIHTFLALSTAKVEKIQAILNAAGPRYQMHNPKSWPQQSALAAKGAWNELDKLQDQLNGGK